MPLIQILLILLVVLVAAVLLLQVVALLRGRGDPGLGAKLDALKDDSARVERTLREEQRAGREELQQGFDRFRGHLGEQLGNAFFKKHGVIAHPCGNTGTQMGGWFRKEIKTVSDLSGLKMRIGGIAGQVLAKLGVVPQQLAGGDIYPSLEKGTIDAGECIGPYDDEKLGFNKVAPYYYYPGFWEGGLMVHSLTNLEKWNALPKHYQSILANANANANTLMAARYDLQNPGALKRLVAGGTQLRPFSNEVLEASLKATNTLWAEISAKNPDFKKSIDAMQAYRGDEYLWWQVAEYTFDSFQIRSRTRG